MARISVQLLFPVDLWAKVESAARSRGVRPGTLIREAVEAYMEKPWQPDEQDRVGVDRGSPYRLARVQLMPGDWERLQTLAKTWGLSGSELIRAAVSAWLRSASDGSRQ